MIFLLFLTLSIWNATLLQNSKERLPPPWLLGMCLSLCGSGGLWTVSCCGRLEVVYGMSFQSLSFCETLRFALEMRKISFQKFSLLGVSWKGLSPTGFHLPGTLTQVVELFAVCALVAGLCQNSVGGQLSSHSAPVPISSTPPDATNAACMLLMTMMCDLMAGLPAALWYVLSRHHFLELPGGCWLWCWRFLTAVSKGWETLVRNLTAGNQVILCTQSVHRGDWHSRYLQVFIELTIAGRNSDFSTVSKSSTIVLRSRIRIQRAERLCVHIRILPHASCLILGNFHNDLVS